MGLLIRGKDGRKINLPTHFNVWGKFISSSLSVLCCVMKCSFKVPLTTDNFLIDDDDIYCNDNDNDNHKCSY
jgi:hypothetical protein